MCEFINSLTLKKCNAETEYKFCDKHKFSLQNESTNFKTIELYNVKFCMVENAIFGVLENGVTLKPLNRSLTNFLIKNGIEIHHTVKEKFELTKTEEEDMNLSLLYG